MHEAIKQAKKRFRPKNIYLIIAVPNKIAKNLYTKLGFVEIVRLPKWRKQNGKYIDKLYILLKK